MAYHQKPERTDNVAGQQETEWDSQVTAQPQAIWVKADVDMDGNYRLAVEYNEDTIVTFDQTRAIAYATEVFTAAAYASYDAAVMAQMKALHLPPAEAFEVVQGLRDDRPPLNDDALGVLRLAPGVSAFTGKPFLACSLANHPARWQWNPADADQHAGHVVQCYPVANLDAAYRRYLMGTVGLDQAHALAAVAGLSKFRED